MSAETGTFNGVLKGFFNLPYKYDKYHLFFKLAPTICLTFFDGHDFFSKVM